MRRIQLLAGVYSCVDVLSLMLRVELRQRVPVRVDVVREVLYIRAS